MRIQTILGLLDVAMADLIANEEYDRRISNTTNQKGTLSPLEPIVDYHLRISR